MKGSSCLKEFIRYASMNILGMLGISFYILVDTFFVSAGMGANGIAALNLAIPVYNLVHGTGLMLGMGGATKYSIYHGIGETGEGNRVFANSLILTGVFTVLFMFAGAFGSGTVAALLGANDDTFAMTETYLKVLLLFSPAFLLNDVLICFVRNDGEPRLSMTAMIAGSLSNIALDYVFIFPMQMGMLGAVLATSLSPILSLIILSRHWIKRRGELRFIKVKPRRAMAGSIFAIGLPSFVTEISSGIVILVFNGIILGLEGNKGVAAYGVVTNLSLVMMAVFTGLAQGMQPLVSRFYSRGENGEARSILHYGMLSMLAIAFLIYGAILIFSGEIAGVFNKAGDPYLQKMAVSGMELYFSAAVFAGFNVILAMFFASVEKAVPAQLISLLRGLVVIVPVVFLLSQAAGLVGVWLAFPASEALTAAVGAAVYLTLKKRLSP